MSQIHTGWRRSYSLDMMADAPGVVGFSALESCGVDDWQPAGMADNSTANTRNHWNLSLEY